jgi:hypothetical protein
MEKDTLLIIRQEEAQIILNYLKTRPYEEVFNLVPILFGLQELDQPNEKAEVEEKPLDKPFKGK